MQRFTTGEYLKNATQATCKYGDLDFQEHTNIFWYVPSIYTLELSNLAYNNKHVSFRSQPVKVNADLVTLDIEANFISNDFTLKQDFKGIRLTQSYLNKSILVPYGVYNHTNYQGVSIQLPKIMEKSHLVINETWHINSKLLRSYDYEVQPQIFSLTREIDFPIEPSGWIRPYDYDINGDMKDWNMNTWYSNVQTTPTTGRLWFAVHNSVNENQVINENKKSYKELGYQSIALGQKDCPTIYLDTITGYAFSSLEYENSINMPTYIRKNLLNETITQNILTQIVDPHKLFEFTHAGLGQYMVKIDAARDNLLTRYRGPFSYEGQILPSISFGDPDFDELCLTYYVSK